MSGLIDFPGEVIEVAVLLDRAGNALYWHLPEDRTAGYIPDHPSLWEAAVANKNNIGGVAHTHPWNGPTGPSQIDVTTFSAWDRAFGRPLEWPIITFDTEQSFRWVGPGPLDFGRVAEPSFRVVEVERLRNLSRK